MYKLMMKKALLLFAALLPVTVCMGATASDRPGRHRVEQRRSLRDFNRIVLLGSLNVKYVQANSYSVVVKAPKNIVGQVETRVEHHRLLVNMKRDTPLINMGGASGHGVTVYVSSPDLLGVELKGSGDFDCERLLDTDTLDIVLKGSGDIDFDNIVCDRIKVELTGSGDVEVDRVTCQQALLELVGSGDIEMRFVDSGVVDSRLVGSGDIKLQGNVKKNRTHVRGSGKVTTDRLRVGR